MSRKLALIIGNSQYQDPRLAQLLTPQEDVSDLAAILRAPDIGGFDEVKTLVNETDANIRLSIEDFFADKKPDDLLVIYFSGHGVRDEQGLLYLAVNNTRANRLRATAIPSEFITGEMDRSRSRRQVLILDCCHSGAFAQGSKAMTGESAGTGPAFEGIGYGRVVLTATDATQYAWEGDKVIGQADRSVFTHYLIEGLRTGEADTDLDGTITLDEMYDYVYEKVVTVTPKQTPGKWSYKQQGDIVIARNPHPPAQPAAPSSEIYDTARNYAAVKTARLIVQQGANPGAIYPLRAETSTIGRSDGLEVTIRDTLISRRQARITLRDGDYFIEDLLSANGTFVNSQKIAGLRALKDGDQIAAGDTILIFQLGEAAPAATANDKLAVGQPQAAAVFAPATTQPQNPAVAAQPTQPLPPGDVPASIKRSTPKWIWIGVAGGIILLLGALLVGMARPAPEPSSTELAPTEPAPIALVSTESQPTAEATVAAIEPATPAAVADSSTPQPAATEPAIQSRPDADPLARVRANWNVVISDSFDTNSQHWDTGNIDEPDNAAGTRQIVDGKYHWEIQANRDYATVASKSDVPDGDFYVSVDVQQSDGSAACGYGLLLRDGDAGVYQFGLANHDKEFSVFAWNEAKGASRMLIGPAASEAIHPGEVNQLAVIAEGTHYQFFINDQPVGEMDDDEWTTGYVTLFLQLCQTADSAVIEFDNMELRTP
jgi:uncharacterized caspase-like protein/pSer/pThr/pTyr-binding forkhead associated (FHA) protein